MWKRTRWVNLSGPIFKSCGGSVRYERVDSVSNHPRHVGSILAPYSEGMEQEGGVRAGVKLGPGPAAYPSDNRAEMISELNEGLPFGVSGAVSSATCEPFMSARAYSPVVRNKAGCEHCQSARRIGRKHSPRHPKCGNQRTQILKKKVSRRAAGGGGGGGGGGGCVYSLRVLLVYQGSNRLHSQGGCSCHPDDAVIVLRILVVGEKHVSGHHQKLHCFDSSVQTFTWQLRAAPGKRRLLRSIRL